MITAAILICLAPIAYDGDTWRCGTSPTRVRLFGLKAPEIMPAGIPGALEAKIAIQAEINGGLICNPPAASYNRIVGHCFNSKGEDIGRKLLAAGHVVEDCVYSKNYYGTCN